MTSTTEQPLENRHVTPEPPAAPKRRSQTSYALASLWRGIRSAFDTVVRLGGQLLGRVYGFIHPVTDVVGAVGWLVLAAAALCLLLGGLLGWLEIIFVGATLLGAMLVAVCFIFGRASYRVEIELQPLRVVAGERALGRMSVSNSGEKALLPVRMELPVGSGEAEFIIPALAPKHEHEELFAVPTQRRAVIVAGPAITVRGDQLGLLRRTMAWTERVELFVHPVTARLAASAAGLVRDLEGETTRTITNNDISFHALRQYEPGDALRNVHWRTSARTGQLMVRQFEETRRSQLTIVHSTEAAHYSSGDEFELAVSVMASLALQVISDDTRLSIVTEQFQLHTKTPLAMLDDTSRIEEVSGRYPSLRDFTREATLRLPAPSVLMMVAGSGLELGEFRAAETLFSSDTKTLAFRAELGAQSRISKVSGLTVVTIGQLGDLPKLLRRVHG